MPGTTFLIGGTGKVGQVLARLLHADNRQVLISSRKGVAPEPFKAVVFDYAEPSTFPNPFDADKNIDSLFFVSNYSEDTLAVVKPFIDFAIGKGVKRYVFVGSTWTQKGSKDWFGTIYQYLADKGVEYTILRPTWFTENFQTGYYYSIKNNGEIITATGDGRIPFVSVDDIAQAAFDAITKDQSPNTDYAILGPELITYDDAARIFSEVLGRKIVHKKVTPEEKVKALLAAGLPELLATELIKGEVVASKGEEEKFLKEPNAIIGGKSVREYVEANKGLWA